MADPDGPGDAGRAGADGHSRAARRRTRGGRGGRRGRGALGVRRQPAGRGAARPEADRTQAMVTRREYVAALLALVPEALVVTGLGSPTWDVFAAGDRPENFYLWGAMGGAVPLSLGLALAQPDRSVVTVTGDGEQLMGLGALATVGAQQPPNLTIVVLDNGLYGETGRQRSHTALGTDLVTVAGGCGI